jgi:putative endonuclease
MFAVNILGSLTSGKWYYGSSGRLAERIIDHNTNHHHYTGGKGPWKLIFRRSFDDLSSALAFEKELKKLRNKNYIKEKFKEYFLNP